MNNRPNYYGGKDNVYEAIKVIQEWNLGFGLGNVVKYIARAGKKGNALEDLIKARTYLDLEIEKLESKQVDQLVDIHNEFRDKISAHKTIVESKSPGCAESIDVDIRDCGEDKKEHNYAKGGIADMTGVEYHPTRDISMPGDYEKLKGMVNRDDVLRIKENNPFSKDEEIHFNGKHGKLIGKGKIVMDKPAKESYAKESKPPSNTWVQDNT